MANQRMVKWLVKKDNWGFQGKYWTVDTVVEFEPDIKPDPQYFELVTKNTVLPEGANVEKPVNTLAEAQAKPFKKEPTMAEVLKGQRHPGEIPMSERDRRMLAEHGSNL